MYMNIYVFLEYLKLIIYNKYNNKINLFCQTSGSHLALGFFAYLVRVSVRFIFI